MNNSQNKPTRAELVRQRQNSHTSGSSPRGRKPAASVSSARRTTTPVTTRGVVNGYKYTPPVQQRVRKQYYYTVGNSTEIRMPAIPTIKIGWRLLSFVLLILAITGTYYLFNAPFLQVNTLQTEGLSRVTSSDINQELDILGKSIIYANSDQAVQTLTAAFPELSDIQVSIELPNQIIISAYERQPVMAWQTDGTLYWIDQEGVLIPPRGESPNLLTIYSEQAPIILESIAKNNEEETTSPNNFANSETETQNNSKIVISNSPQWGDRIDPVTINAAHQLQTKIPSGTTILFDETHGMGWRAEQGWDVFIGLTLNDIEYKLKAYEVLINKLSMEGITPSMVSVEYAHAPFYRE